MEAKLVRTQKNGIKVIELTYTVTEIVKCGVDELGDEYLQTVSIITPTFAEKVQATDTIE